MIRSDFANVLGIKGKKEWLKLSGIGGSKPGEKAKLRERLNIKIGSRNENQANIDGFFEIDAWKVPVITNPVGPYNLKKDWNFECR